jgi:ribose transport system substrate-binding protein
MLGTRRELSVAVAAVLFLSTGCERFSSSKVICVIPRQASQAMWVSEHVGANQTAARYQASVYWNGPTEDGNVEQQVELADRAIRNHDIGLVLSPINPFALNTVVQRSLAARMPVVIVGKPLSLPAQPRLSFVLNDEKEGGVLAAERIDSILKHRGQVLILGIDPVFSSHADGVTEFETTLAREAPDISVVGRLKSSYNFGQAEFAAEKAIRSNPHLSAIWALNSMATRGAIAAANTTHTTKRIAIIGGDYNVDLLFLLRHGMIDSLVAQNMRAMGEMAVDSIMKQAHGQPVASYAYLKPVLITRENIDSDPIQWMLYMDWRVKP